MRTSFLILSAALLAGSVVLPSSSQAAPLPTPFRDRTEGENSTGFSIRANKIRKELKFPSPEGRILTYGLNQYRLTVKKTSYNQNYCIFVCAEYLTFARKEENFFLNGNIDGYKYQHSDAPWSFEATITRLPGAIPSLRSLCCDVVQGMLATRVSGCRGEGDFQGVYSSSICKGGVPAITINF